MRCFRNNLCCFKILEKKHINFLTFSIVKFFIIDFKKPVINDSKTPISNNVYVYL